jgi:hypothetical protein
MTFKFANFSSNINFTHLRRYGIIIQYLIFQLKLYIHKLYISLRLKFCFMPPFLPFTWRSSSLQFATCTVVYLQPLHIPQALTLRTKLPFVNTNFLCCLFIIYVIKKIYISYLSIDQAIITKFTP